MVSPIKLHCKPGSKLDHLLRGGSLPILSELYWPPPWCFDTHAQTVMASAVRRLMMPDIKYDRQASWQTN